MSQKASPTTEHALTLNHVSKVYRVYEKPADRLRELLFRRSYHREFVAVERIDLSIRKGCTLGIVGDNGAGKSTLLKLIAGSLAPTEGSIDVRGEVLGLLELGVGFHLEFTGRQNVFFYADVLGLPRTAVHDRFDDILAFSELGDFIDQPLKTYSTGMRMRLGFAMVSTLEPDILIVDEALAVGDIHFQKKCIDRMMGIKRSGKTIIFCSHSIYQISMFCDQVLWMKNGRIEEMGPTADIIPLYEAYQMQKDPDTQSKAEQPEPHTLVRIAEFSVVNELPIAPGDDLGVRLKIESENPELSYHVSLSLKMDSGRGVFVTGTHLENRPALNGARRIVEIEFPKIPLLGGLYSLHARVFDDEGLMVYHQQVLSDLTVKKTSAILGICQLQNQWSIS